MKKLTVVIVAVVLIISGGLVLYFHQRAEERENLAAALASSQSVLTFTATPNPVAYNSPATLLWSGKNATGCVGSGGWSGPQATSSSLSTGNLTATQGYTISCTIGGHTVTQSLTVTVKPLPTNDANSYDVVVVGAGTGGTAAAIEAARLGKKVALIEPTDYIGGQMTAGGVPCIDDGRGGVQLGIYQEFLTKIKSYYADPANFPAGTVLPKSIHTCYADVSFEPSVGQKILKQMLTDAGVHVFLRQNVASVITSGSTVTGVVTKEGTTFPSKVVIDATEYGDVLSLVPNLLYRVGNSLSTNIQNPTTNRIQDITYSVTIKKYPQGIPSALVMQDPPPGYNPQLFYNSIHTVATATGTMSMPTSAATVNKFRGNPDSSNPHSYTSTNDPQDITKTQLNSLNDYPYYAIDLTDLNQRVVDNCNAKLLALQFMYYLQHSVSDYKLWSVADDEGYNTPYNIQDNSCSNIPQEFKTVESYMPTIPYIRESKRIVGLTTVTGSDIMIEKNGNELYPSSIAVGTYGTDMHNGHNQADLENSANLSASGQYKAGDTVKDIGTFAMPVYANRFQVPFEALIPLTIDGFIAAEKNTSVSRIASGATREQPITMLTGEAAGAIAAEAITEGVQPRNVNVVKVQEILTLAGSRIAANDQFTDVVTTSQYWPYVQQMIVHNFMRPVSYSKASGTMDTTWKGVFGVANQFPGSELASIINRIHNILPQSNRHYGIVNPCSTDSTLCAANAMTVNQVAVVISRWLGLPVVDSSAEQALANMGIIDSTLSPTSKLNRGQVAKIITKLYEYVSQK